MKRFPLALTLALTFSFCLAAARAEDSLLDLANKDENCNAFYRALHQDTRPVDSVRDANDRTMLHLATRAHNQHNAFILLQRDANVNARDKDGGAPLHYAASSPARPDAQMLLELLCVRHADLNAVDHDGATPLALAILAENPDAVEFLLRAGANPNPKGVPTSVAPRALAAATENKEIARLMEHPEKLAFKVSAAPRLASDEEKRDLFAAAARGNVGQLQKLVEAGVSLEVQNDAGRSVLFCAAVANQPTLVSYLLLLGANPNLADKDGETPLSFLVNYFGFSYDKMREMLLAAGANPQLEDSRHWNPIASSAARGNVHGLQSAIWTGVEPTIKTPQGTLMHLASKNSRQAAIDLLRLYGVDEAPYVGDSPNWAFFDAVLRGDVGKTKSLLDQGQAVDVVDEASGNTAFMRAMSANVWNTADLLLQRGANPKYVNPKNGSTPLLETAYWSGPQPDAMRKKLLEAGADPNVANHDGITPLIQSATSSGVCPAVKQLLDAGADVNAKDGKGRTTLSIARGYQNDALIEVLTKYGAK